jgi:hypothetical protein
VGANPADLLYTQLMVWNTTGRETSDQRRGVGSDPREALRRHEAALSNLRAIGELLDVAEKANLFPVHEYREEIPEWGKMILAFPHGWAQAANFNRESLRLLSTLGPQLRHIVPQLADGSVETFEQALDKVLEALKADTTIGGEVARYLLNLVIHMKLVIEEYRMGIRGDYDLARAATLLKTTIDTAYNKSTDDEAKPRWAWLREIFSVRTAIALAIQWSTVWPTLMLPPAGH